MIETRWGNRTFTRVQVVAFLMLACAGTLVCAEEAVPPVLRLPHVEGGFLYRFEAPPECLEPREQGQDEVHGRVPTGVHEEDWIPFVLDPPSCALWLDLNGDGDFTNDPEGVFPADSWSKNGLRTGAEGVRIGVQRDGARVPYLLDLQFVGAHRGNERVGRQLRGLPVYRKVERDLPDRLHITVRSGWRGTVELGGRACEFAYADNLNGLVDEEDVFSFERHRFPGQSTGRVFDGPIVRALCLNGKTYDLAFGFDGQDAACEWTVSFDETSRPTGTVVLEGQHVARIGLYAHDTSEHMEVIASGESHGAHLRLPLGKYEVHRVDLDAQAGHYTYTAFCRDAPMRFTVKAEEPAAIRRGGPLQPGIEATQEGDSVTLQEAVTGVGGRHYYVRSNGPCKQFTVSIAKWGIDVSRFFPPLTEYG